MNDGGISIWFSSDMPGLSPRGAATRQPCGERASPSPVSFRHRVPALVLRSAMRDLIPLLIAHGALIVFVITLAARVGAPVPAAPLLVVAGGVAMAGQISLLVCVAVSVVANVLGDAVWYQA